jgi:hypothetical protein
LSAAIAVIAITALLALVGLLLIFGRADPTARDMGPWGDGL